MPDVSAPFSTQLDHPTAEALIVRLHAAFLSQAELINAAAAFCAEAKEAFKAERTSLGLKERPAVRVIATSAGWEINPKSESARILKLAMQECVDQRAVIAHPAPPGAFPFITLAHENLICGSVTAVYSLPLMHQGEIVGILTIERSKPMAEWELANAEDASSFAGPLLGLKRDAEKSWVARLTCVSQAAVTRLASRGHLAPKLTVATVLLLALAFIPLPSRVSAPARLEGSVQRVIVAPADGFLRQANARAGDHVKEGQILAELASEDLQLEKARRESELRQHEDAYKAALARSDRAQMVIHQAKAGEAQAMLSLVQGQLDRAQIQSPLDGIVIKGDLSQNLGAPVQRGEALLTIAPGDSFRVIVEVDETDIAAIKKGQHGRLVLAAEPDQQFNLQVSRIVPVATAADARNYFEIEASLDQGATALRPGLRGIAKIDVGARSLLWTISHRPINWLRYWLWSVGL
ncbi:MAG: hypothetical protein JWN73_1892 [Betaproteobacteria bacterium]|nr:hypothetical protein [Betaproteobacteria bacterium]